MTSAKYTGHGGLTAIETVTAGRAPAPPAAVEAVAAAAAAATEAFFDLLWWLRHIRSLRLHKTTTCAASVSRIQASHRQLGRRNKATACVASAPIEKAYTVSLAAALRYGDRLATSSGTHPNERDHHYNHPHQPVARRGKRWKTEKATVSCTRVCSLLTRKTHTHTHKQHRHTCTHVPWHTPTPTPTSRPLPCCTSQCSNEPLPRERRSAKFSLSRP